MRALLLALLVLAACGGDEEAPPEREMAGPGYIPPGAPLKPPPAPPPHKGFKAIEFDTLRAFDYDPEADIVPDDVRKLDGKQVELRGVMYYAVEDPEKVTDFYLMPDHMVCCFGTPRLNDAVEIIQKKGGVTQYVVNYYLIRGKLAVGQVTNEEGTVLCIYRITDADVEVLE
ncbi:MAG: DUF3299 domain-containing protein [Planctomycetota bacterium]